MNAIVRKLKNRLIDTCDTEKLLRIVDALAMTRDVSAIPVLASMLDIPASVGRAAVDALVGFGDAAIPAMHECLEADDEDMIRNAHRVLAALGDAYSAHAQHARCWADLEWRSPSPTARAARTAEAA